jgi:hypothetical protein
LLLEIDNKRIHRHGLYGLTLASLAAAIGLFVFPLGKRTRIAVIGGLGGFVFLGVLLVVAAFSRPSRLTAFYPAMVTINCVGGWQYLRQSDKIILNGPPEYYLAKGHTLMHICSVVASVIYGIALVQVACRV